MVNDNRYIDDREKDRIVDVYFKKGRVMSQAVKITRHHPVTVRNILEERDLIGFGKLHYHLSPDIMEDAGFDKDGPTFSYNKNGSKHNVYVGYSKDLDKTTVVLEKRIKQVVRKSEVYLVVRDGDITDKIKGKEEIDALEFMHIKEDRSLETKVLVKIGL